MFIFLRFDDTKVAGRKKKDVTKSGDVVTKPKMSAPSFAKAWAGEAGLTLVRQSATAGAVRFMRFTGLEFD